MQLLHDRKNILYYSIVCAILAAGFFLRLYQLSSYPLQINQDELSNIYDGYSIAETGADRWGTEHPLSLRGFGNGDYRPSLYAWLCAGSIKVLGPTIFAGRLPSALLGCLSLLFIFLVARKIGGKLFAGTTLLLAALMPWHIIYSRMAHEGLIFPGFFFILSTYFWIRLKETNYKTLFLLLLGLSIGLGTSTCHAGKLIFFTFSLLIIIDLFISRAASFKTIGILAIALLLGALPQAILLAFNNIQFMSRANNTVLPWSLTYGYINNLFDALYSNFSPHFLFFSFGQYNKHSVGRLMNIECLFFYVGLFYFYHQYKGKSPLNPAYLLLLLFIAILPASLTDDNPHAIRSSCLVMLLSIFSATGFVYFFERIKSNIGKNIFLSATVILVLGNGIYFVRKYPTYAGDVMARHQNGLVNLAQKVNGQKDKFSKVIIQDVGNQPYIYFAYYCGITPQQFQTGEKQYVQNASEGNWDHFTRIGKHYFVHQDTLNAELNKPGNETVLFITSSNFHQFHVFDSVFVDDKMYFFTTQH